ncbi:hypothetical protein ACS0TY_029773 [Phlomoides rotata]
MAQRPTGPSLTMTLPDRVLLDCPICFQALCSPVYQCENGHIACASCRTTLLKNNCPHCRLPIGNIRCRAIEEILESGRVLCEYAPYGCLESFSYNKKLAPAIMFLVHTLLLVAILLACQRSCTITLLKNTWILSSNSTSTL